MTATTVYLNSAGALSLNGTVPPQLALEIQYELHSYLGDGVALDVAFFKKNNQPTAPENVSCRLKWVDTFTDDVIYQVEGLLIDDEDDTSSLVSRIWAMEIVKNFTVSTTGQFATGVMACSTAFNDYNTVGNKVERLNLATDNPPAFDEDAAYNAVIMQDMQIDYLALPSVEDAAVNSLMLRLANKLNVPLYAELEPDLTVDTAITTAENLGFDSHLVQLIWSPNIARPMGSVSVRGRKEPVRMLGQYIGKLLSRNAKTDAAGIPPLHEPVAGADNPFNGKGLEPNPDIVLDQATLERLAQAKVNVVRRQRYSIGTFFALSDGLTMYDKKTSALRLVNAADIAAYTARVLVDICHRHMLKSTASFLSEASRDITRFLDACAAAGLIVPSEDTGTPYSFKLTPDVNFPFERVRLEFSRCPSGMVRSVVFDDVIVK